MRKKAIDTNPRLTVDMYEILNRFSKSRTLPASLVKRSKIILMSALGETNQKIGKELGVHYINVATWRNRFMENLSNLQELENSATEKLADEITRILSDEKRPGVPAKFTPEQIIRIIDLACKSPADYGYEVSHWSLSLLAI